MLQQTQVATVIDYYHRFLEIFPTVHALAAADLEDVLQLWSGLGYYRRARSLHAASKQIVEQFSGKFPVDIQQLQQLQGVGRYTAGAIASFAFDQPAPILEANTIRLFSRLIGNDQPTSLGTVQKALWHFAQEILPDGPGSGQLNQAVMELGSLVCVPQQPLCPQCPVRKLCQAYKSGRQNEIPPIPTKPPPTQRMHVGLLVQDRQQSILLRQNPPGQWWQGLWDLPWIEWPFQKVWTMDPLVKRELNRAFFLQLGTRCRVSKTVATIRHAVSKFKIDYHCVRATLSEVQVLPEVNSQLAWFPPHDLPPLSSRMNRLLKQGLLQA